MVNMKALQVAVSHAWAAGTNTQLTRLTIALDLALIGCFADGVNAVNNIHALDHLPKGREALAVKETVVAKIDKPACGEHCVWWCHPGIET